MAPTTTPAAHTTSTTRRALIPWADVPVWGTTGQGRLHGEERLEALRDLRDSGGCAAWMADPSDFGPDDEALVYAGPGREDIDWSGFPDGWDYEGYWNAVCGANDTPHSLVCACEFEGATRRAIDEWLGVAEAEAFAGRVPDSWAQFHARALDALEDAATIRVVWGEGPCLAVTDTDSDLLPYTPWAGQELVGEQWVTSWVGDPSELDREPAVLGYRRLAEHEIAEWRSY